MELLKRVHFELLQVTYIYTMNQTLPSDIQVRHSNVLTNARYEYSRTQLDLLYFIISKLRKSQDSLVYELNISELSALTKKPYYLPRLIEATEGMISRVFYSSSPEEGVKQFNMLQSCNYPPAPGTIKVKLNEDILPHLFDIKKNFTSLHLQAVLLLTSKFAKRIYPMCSQWKDKGETKKYEIEDFKRMLNLIDKEGNEKLKEFNDLRKTVLDPSVKQINEHTELHISYELGKVGKRYKYITFTVKQQVPKISPPFLLEAPQPDTPLLLPGISQQQYENCAAALDQFYEIKDPRILETILSNPDHIRATFQLKKEIMTGQVIVRLSRAGLLFSRLGIKRTPA